MPAKDPYSILGVTRTASADEIKRAYRRLAKEHHPDRNRGDKRAEERFKEIQAAYEVLGDPEHRAQFDRFGGGGPEPEFHRWRSQAGSDDVTFSDFGDLSSIIEQFFRRGAPGPGPRGGATRGATAGAGGSDGTLEHAVELSFEECAHGTHREVVLSHNGQTEHIRVKIPAGVNDGQRIRVPEKGNITARGRGDLLIVCHIRPHAYFRRDGLDVMVDVPISVADAILGATVEVPTLEGRVSLKVPPGTSSGSKLRVREQGIHEPRTGAIGDLLAVVKIVAPRQISDAVRSLGEQLRAALDPQDRSPAAPWKSR